jgi:1,4-dihydroxy-2-naphthoyl-CoA hydrolase
MPLPTPSTWLQLQRSVGFAVIAAAGVMHFHQLQRWRHEAHKMSLERFGLPAASVFPRPELAGDSPEVALPIVY